MSYDDTGNVIPLQQIPTDLNGHGSLNGHNPKPRELPTIETNNRQLSDKRDELIDAIATYNNPPRLFHSDNGLAVIGIDKDDLPAIVPAKREAIQNIMADAARWVSTSKDGPRSVAPPRDLAENYIAQHGKWKNVPAIDGIVTAPVFAADGTLCCTRGYNSSSRLWLSLPAGFHLPDTTPTAKNIASAREIIFDTLLGEVAFADDASKTHAIALMLLPFVRQMIPGPTPLHLIDSPAQSSGKSYAAKICISPFARPVASAMKGDEEEWRKAILAALMSGRAHVFFDNVKGKLNSPMLAAAITEPYLTERAMGGLTEVTVKVRSAWVATSNNANLDSDTASRCIVIRVDTNMENPESRTFSHDPLAYIDTQRSEVIAAILTLVRLWQEEGSPLYAGQEQSRFGHWQKVIGGIIGACDIPGFLTNLKEFRIALDPEQGAWVALTESWLDQFQYRYVTAKDLVPLALDIPEIGDGLAGREGHAQTKSLGKQLGERRDKVFGHLKIVGGIQARGGKTYKVMPVGTNDPQSQLDIG